MEHSVASLHTADSEEIKPYRIHVSSKYLDLTKKKLELTRLPHEVLLPREREWEYGTPKSEIEPLIDFWLEQYTWRNREAHLNSTLPQFRTALSYPSIPASPSLRIHFLHIKSPHKHALPLLLIPTFPLTNLSLAPLLEPLTSPTPPTSTQPFHVVVPSLPGLGFSDGFKCSSQLLSKSAALCDALMRRLGYTGYVASATGAGRDSPAGIDYHLLRILGEEHPDSCLGIHLIEPCVHAPTVSKEPIGWLKFTLANFFHARIWGYEKADFLALAQESRAARTWKTKQRLNDEETPLLAKRAVPRYGAVGMVGLREPNTFAYALCDSPVGLLSLVCSALRRRSPAHTLTNTEVIDVTQLAWLPGPEAGARFWAAAVEEVAAFTDSPASAKTKSRVAVTVFGSDGDGREGKYVCPAWARSQHDVVFAQRVSGRPGIPAWERTDVLIDGIRGLAREVESVDERLRASTLNAIVADPSPTLEETEEDDEWSEHGMQLEVESPDTVVNVNTRGG